MSASVENKDSIVNVVARNPILQFFAFIFALGALIHLSDILNLRQNFHEMTTPWQYATVFLLFVDTLAAVGLFFKRWWGLTSFLTSSITQLVGYFFFSNLFGRPIFLVVLHVCLLGCYASLVLNEE